jgi:hypothetical protein
MKRRKFLTAFGGLTVGSSAVVSSGAFSTVDAARILTIETADDNDSLLKLEQLGDPASLDGGRSGENGFPEVVSFSFPGVTRRLEDPETGLNVDSVYEFDQDSGEADDPNPVQGLLRITNQGTQAVSVYSRHSTDSELGIELYDVTDPSRTALRDDPAALGVGSSVDVGFRIRTFDAELGEFDETLAIVADPLDN